MHERAFLGRAAFFAGTILVAIAFVVATPLSASAHTISGPRPTNYLTTLGSVSPEIPGIRVRVVELGNKLELTNRTAADIVVLGYDFEPYLRIGPRGVYENLRSRATYANRTRSGTTTVPKIALGTTASTPPRWHRVSGAHTATWHDHRVHWMGASRPDAVRRDPGAAHTLNPRWIVLLHYEGKPVSVVGRLDWIPGPDAWPWLPLIAALFAAGCVAARRRRAAWVIGVVGLIVALDVTHAVTAEVARPGTQLDKTLQFLGDNFVSVIIWIAALITIRSLRRDGVVARYGVLLVGVMVALVTGLSDLSYLWKSQLPTVGPSVIARGEVAAALGLGFGVAAGALVFLRRSVPRAIGGDGRDPRWIERIVGDLDGDALEIVCGRLSAGEVIPLGLTDVAARAAPTAVTFGSDALVFVVLAQDAIGTHIWSLTAGARGLRVQRGTPAPMRAELRTTFPAFLQLLAGTRTVAALMAAGRLDLSGDPDLVDAVEPYLRPDATADRPVATV